MFKFRNTNNLKQLLDDTCGKELMLPSSSDDKVILFHNGDKMTVDLNSGIMDWEPIKPGSFTTSRLSMRLHQWFAKGIIKEYVPDNLG